MNPNTIPHITHAYQPVHYVPPTKPVIFPYVKRCPACDGTGIHMSNPDYPMGDYGIRKSEPCLHCGERGYTIPPEWTQG